MRRINFIWNSKDWKIDIEGINKNIPNDIVYRMIIGCGYDEEYYEIYEFISKDNYENIIITGDFKNHYTIYGDLNYLGISIKNLESMSCARIFDIANCFIDNKNNIKKNRWGDSDYE